jgi:hypothetical protein
MALIKCKECGKEISSAAAACPNCGNPIPKQSQLGTGCLIVIIFFVVLAVIGQCSDKDSKLASAPAPAGPAPGQSAPASTVPQTAPAPPITIDLKDAKALDDKYGTDALVYCASGADDYLRGASKFAFKWDEIGFFEQKFGKILTDVSSPGILTMISDKVSLQNGFGAYERIQLYCEYDTQAKKTIAYSINSPPYHAPPALEPSVESQSPPGVTLTNNEFNGIAPPAPANTPVSGHANTTAAPEREPPEQRPAIRAHGEPFVIRGIEKHCNDITQLDRALSTQYDLYFDGWTRADYDEAIIWSSACAQYGWQSIAKSRVSLLQARETSALTR